MADLHGIYQELGLAGIVPHAIRDKSQGRLLLIEHIREGDSLFFIRTGMNVPFITVKDDTYQSLTYTSYEDAERKKQELVMSHFDVYVETMPGDDGRSSALQWIFDHGPTSILLDDSISIPIGQLTEVPTYDGQPNEEHLLRNRALNGAIYYFLQIAAAQMSNPEAERAWAKKMVSSSFLVLAEDNPAENYPVLTVYSGGKPCALVYSDWRQVCMDFGERPVGITSNFDDLKDLLRANPGLTLLLNPATCHMVIDLNLLNLIRQIEAGTYAGTIMPAVHEEGTGHFAFPQVSEEDWDKVDPTPSWLK